MGISDRKRSIDVPVSINLDLNQEPKPNQLIVGNTLKGGDFVSRKKSGNILAGSKLNVEGQGILTVKNVTPDLFKKLSKQTPISGGNPPSQTPSQTPSKTPTQTPTPTPTNVGCSGIPYNLSTIFDIPISGDILFADLNIYDATNNPDGLNVNGGIYFNVIDSNGTDQTSYFSNLIGNEFLLTLCQNNATATYSGSSDSFIFDGIIYYCSLESGANFIETISANTLFNYNELVYVDYTAVVLTPTPTPTITPTPSITPTYTPTPTPTPPPPFISVWRTTSPSESITLPYSLGNIYTGFIDWGDGSLSANTYSNRIHTYVFSGDYTVRIYGSIDTMRFNNSGDKLKIREILQWGPNFHLKTLGTFYGCGNLVLTGVTDTPLISLDGAVSIFEDCVSITTINNLNSWNISSITNMASMFKGCTNFNQPLSGWNVSNVTVMNEMFNGCSSFNQPLSGWDVSNVLAMGNMFSFATQFDQPIGNWTVSGVTTMFGMFSYATSFNQPLSGWDVSNVINMSFMFSNSSFNQPIGNWTVSGVSTMTNMFEFSLYNQPLSGWNVSNLADTRYMFYGSQFDQPIGNWDVSGVFLMNNMFSDSLYNQPLSGWDVSNVINMDTMFYSSQFDQPIGNWNVSGVTNMSNMFGFSQFNQPLSGWNVSNVTNMGGMFGSSQFDQPIGNWNVSGVTYMNGMFQYSLFNQPLSGWDVSNIINMSFMFRQSTFNQDIGNWDISGVISFTDFMDGKIPATFSTTNLDSIYSGWSTKNPYTGLTINFGSANYTTSGGAAGKAILTGSTGSGGYAWTITDGGGI